MEAVEDDAFADEMRNMSAASETTASATAVATAETVRRECSIETSEATIPLKAKESKRRGRPRKEQQKSGRSHPEKDLPTRRRDESHSDGAGNWKANDGKRSGSHKGNKKQTRGSSRVFTQKGPSRLRSRKVQHSCATRTAYYRDSQRTCSGVRLAYAKVGNY